MSFSFSLPLGWALKQNQNYGKKGRGKRLSRDVVEALKQFFMTGQANASDWYSAKDMYNGLKEMVENRILNEEEIPTQKTIENWIFRYSQESRREVAEQALIDQRQK